MSVDIDCTSSPGVTNPISEKQSTSTKQMLSRQNGTSLTETHLDEEYDINSSTDVDCVWALLNLSSSNCIVSQQPDNHLVRIASLKQQIHIVFEEICAHNFFQKNRKKCKQSRGYSCHRSLIEKFHELSKMLVLEEFEYEAVVNENKLHPWKKRNKTANYESINYKRSDEAGEQQ